MGKFLEELNEYDKINTTAVRWLKWNKDERKQELGVDKLDKSLSCKWLLNTFFNYSILTNSIYYTKNIFVFMDQFFFKKHKNIRLSISSKNNIFWIEAPLFISEISSLSTISNITEKIYNYYYRR